MIPAAICPEKPRKSWSGRLTHCTGIRNALLRVGSGVELDRFEMLEQGRPVVPRRGFAAADDIVAVEPAKRGSASHCSIADTLGERRDNRRRSRSNAAWS